MIKGQQAWVRIRGAPNDPESFDLATWNGMVWEIPRINSLGDTIHIQIMDYVVINRAMAKVTRPTRLNLSRREFTRGAAIAAATAVVPKPRPGDERALDSGEGQTASSSQATQLTPDAEAQVQVILTRYGKRLSDEQKIDLRRLVAQAQKASATLRSFPLENSDEPAMIFHIYRLER